jgi:hypothetical protein
MDAQRTVPAALGKMATVHSCECEALIEWRDGRAELSIGDDVLVLKHDGKVVVTEREARKK